MKKLLYILFAVTLFTACSSDDDNFSNVQDYTSFVFEQTVDVNLPNCVAAYKRDNKYYKIADLGNLSKGKQTAEIKVTDKSITEIYFFTDYNSVIRLDATYYLKKNTKNILKLLENTKGIGVTDKSDQTQYPK